MVVTPSPEKVRPSRFAPKPFEVRRVRTYRTPTLPERRSCESEKSTWVYTAVVASVMSSREPSCSWYGTAAVTAASPPSAL